MRSPRRLRLCFVCTLLLSQFAGGCGAPVMAPVQTRDREQPPVVAGEATPAPRTAIQANADSYLVQKGDTVYSIAWRVGEDFRDVARWNGIEDPYLIVPGQVLRLRAPAAAVPSMPEPAAASAAPAPAPGSSAMVQATAPAGEVFPSYIQWHWPTRGTVLHSAAPTSRNGIDISGRRGQSITAAASGFVVYSGSGLLGYGRLIIVKHSDTFLSAYAHNDTLLVKEGERVSSGQQIATMGIGNGGKPVLHFEIRKDGKPVNPFDHLPKAPS